VASDKRAAKAETYWSVEVRVGGNCEQERLGKEEDTALDLTLSPGFASRSFGHPYRKLAG